METVGSHSRLLHKEIPEAYIAAPLLFLAIYLSIGGLVKLGAANSMTWGVVYLLGFLWMGVTPRRTLARVLRFWPLMLLPAFALLSALWSEDIAKTLRTGTQFLFTTILAVRIATSISPAGAISCVFYATLLGFCLSLAAFVAAPLQPAFEENGAFIGVFVQKTVAGLALTLFALSLCAKGALSGHRIVTMFLALCILPLLIMTKSVSAMVLLGCLTIIVLQGLVKDRSATTRFEILALFTIFTLTSLTIIWLDSFDLTTFLLELAGKNTSLTGRTDIWELGLEVAEDYPLLGVGYAAFWGNPVFIDEWGFIHATVDPRLQGFHNIYIEALASTGIISVVLIVIIYYWTLLKALFWFIGSGNAAASFWLAVMIAGILMSFVDNVFYAEHEFFHIVATMTFVFASTYSPPLRWGITRSNPMRRKITQGEAS